MSATYAPEVTCPDSCPLKGNGCYGRNFRLNYIWHRGTDVGDVEPWEIAEDEARRIGELKGDRPLRVHVLGDCKDVVSARVIGQAMVDYVERTGQGCWAYTHSWREIGVEEWQGAKVWASCERVEEVKEARERGYSAVVIVREKQPGMVMCPAMTHGLTCAECMLCWTGKKVVVGFYPHGRDKKKVERMIG